MAPSTPRARQAILPLPRISSSSTASMAVHGRLAKRARVTAEPCLLDMRAFPAVRAAGACDGAFRGKVRGFLARHAAPGQWVPDVEDGVVLGAGDAVWKVGLRVGEEAQSSAVVVMEVVEEDVPRAKRVHCDHCTVAGWSRHPVCGKKYHFIIRNENNTNCKTCKHCGLEANLFETRCLSCNPGYEYSHEDQEGWDYAQFDNPRHLLHGIVHENGFGHLVRINGHEGGSSFLTGYQIMDFWDWLCRYLRVRKVSVMDVSKKFDVDYRILHAVANGCSWYGQWGFRLGTGSFGITPETYCKAIDNLSSVPLSHFFPHTRSLRNQLQDTIAFYQSLSKRPLTVLRELFLYIMGLASCKNGHNYPMPMHEKEAAYEANLEGKWSDGEIKRAKGIALKVLRAADRWVAMRTLKAATSHPIGSPQLVDYCIKNIGGTITNDGMVVVVRCNSEANTLEYRLSNEIIVPRNNECVPTREHLLRGIKFLYDALLYPHTMHPYKTEQIHEHAKASGMVLLDCKQFIKHYDWEDEFLPKSSPMLHIWCQLELLGEDGDPPCIPPELLSLPQTATVGDLKMTASGSFKDIYLMLHSFVAIQLLDCPSASDATQIKLLFGANGTVRLQGRCVGSERNAAVYRMERGVDKWTVKCPCGAEDDDGERMMSCDSCHVWQHTRCAGISDFDQVPRRFVCKPCKLVVHKPKMYSNSPYKKRKVGTGALSHVSWGLWRPHIS